jgi:hydroxyacylglutathione hydrolase
MQVTEHAHAIKIPFQVPVGPGRHLDRFVYAFLVCGRELCLIDTGVRGSDRTIFDYVGAIGRRPDEITRVVLTHSHPDHLGAARAIVAGTGAAVFAHAAERAWIEDVELQARERPIPGFGSLVEGSLHVDHELADGETIELDPDLSLGVFHTPGHSPGSISIWLGRDGALVSGDAVPLPGDFPIYVDVLASVRSLRRLAEIDGLRALMSSWDEPRHGGEAAHAISAALTHLERIHQAVRATAKERPESSPAQIALGAMERLSMPSLGQNPLFVRSVEAHLALSAESLLDPG